MATILTDVERLPRRIGLWSAVAVLVGSTIGSGIFRVPSTVAADVGSLGAIAQKVSTTSELEAAIAKARKAERTSVIVIDTDAMKTTEAGGFWWDVPVAEVSQRPKVRAARKRYKQSTTHQRIGA